jgi:hypothetical protein
MFCLPVRITARQSLARAYVLVIIKVNIIVTNLRRMRFNMLFLDPSHLLLLRLGTFFDRVIYIQFMPFDVLFL